MSEEMQEAEAIFKAFRQILEDLTSRKTDRCPSCHQIIEHMEQIGRCVYAEPWVPLVAGVCARSMETVIRKSYITPKAGIGVSTAYAGNGTPTQTHA